jgi:hypothetical protein
MRSMSRSRRAPAGTSSSRALERAGAVHHLAEVAQTRALRGRKRRAKTDRAHARWPRTLLWQGRFPEAWIPADHIGLPRTRVALGKPGEDPPHQLLVLIEDVRRAGSRAGEASSGSQR